LIAMTTFKRGAGLGKSAAFRRQMAPQGLEKIDSAPDNRMAPEASNLNVWHQGARVRSRQQKRSAAFAPDAAVGA
jgi:hypothetical protein